MKLSISGIGPDKERNVVTWTNGNIQSNVFLKALYDTLGRELKVRTLLHHPTAVSNMPDDGFSLSAFFYISRFILKDVKIIEGSIQKEDYIPEGAET